MARKKKLRKIYAPPFFKGYRPYGCPKECKGSVDLLYEEYEALKLADYDLLNYEQAALLMGVSRATFARICEKARRKISRAMVEGKEIKAVYGNVYFDQEWFLCNDCYARFHNFTAMVESNCPECDSENINSVSIQN